jgi:uncharacterized protein YjbJ (UPF0337 family)
MASISELQEVTLGLTDKAVGLTKEAWGTVLNRSSLSDAGKAQQDKGTARLEAVQHEVKADAKRAKATAQEKIERSQQNNPGARDSSLSDSGPSNGIGGVFERVKGQAKQAVGSVTDDARMKREGEAQQAKGQAKTDAAKEEAKAEASRAKVRTADARQRGADEAS